MFHRINSHTGFEQYEIDLWVNYAFKYNNYSSGLVAMMTTRGHSFHLFYRFMNTFPITHCLDTFCTDYCHLFVIISLMFGNLIAVCSLAHCEVLLVLCCISECYFWFLSHGHDLLPVSLDFPVCLGLLLLYGWFALWF